MSKMFSHETMHLLA